MRKNTESSHQIAIFHWAAMSEKKYPELKLLHASANGGKRNAATAARMKREGVKAGIPDIFLPVARGGFSGLYIELKRPKLGNSPAGRPTKKQLEWIDDLANEGFMTMVCIGADSAVQTIRDYLRAA